MLIQPTDVSLMVYLSDFGGSYPINNTTATGNGGCDAILGSECSRNIRNALKQLVELIRTSF